MKKSARVLLSAIVLALALALLLIFIKYPAEKAEINENSVMEIIDGDTFKMWSGEIVRLICVDAPERGRAGYEDAKEFLSFLILNKEVKLERDVSDRDAYGRLLRYVYVAGDSGEIFVNKEIVQQGFGSVFRYGNDTARCGEIEGEYKTL